MKSSLGTLNEVLTYMLEGMYDAEKQIQEAVPGWIRRTASNTLKNQIRKYRESSKDKRMKLKRIFAYLLAGPYERKNGVVKEILKDMVRVPGLVESRQLADVVFIASLHSLNQYKESEYSAARDIALQLELQQVADLLGEILEWEAETGRTLTSVALTVVNQKVREVEVIQ